MKIAIAALTLMRGFVACGGSTSDGNPSALRLLLDWQKARRARPIHLYGSLGAPSQYRAGSPTSRRTR